MAEIYGSRLCWSPRGFVPNVNATDSFLFFFSLLFFLKPAFMTLPRRPVTMGHCSSIFYSLLGRCTVLEELDVNIFLFSAATAKSLPTANYDRGQFECCFSFFSKPYFSRDILFTRGHTEPLVSLPLLLRKPPGALLSLLPQLSPNHPERPITVRFTVWLSSAWHGTDVHAQAALI